jgi:predicted RNA binding protein YcfA (HicA-like mRNA interferase family)
MPKLPVVKAKDIVRIAEKLGFFFSRQKGSHIIYHHSDGRRITVSKHNKQEIAPSILLQIIKDLDLTKEKFIKILKKKRI